MSDDAIEKINTSILNCFLKRMTKMLFGEDRKIFEFLSRNHFNYKRSVS